MLPKCEKWQRCALSQLKVCFMLFPVGMRGLFFIAMGLVCTHLALAGSAPLTGKDVVLMLRMGYSPQDIVRDLEAKHFVGPLDANSEAQIRELDGSSKLLDSLKSGQFDATKDEVAQAEQKSAAASAEAKAEAQQQATSPDQRIEKHPLARNQNRKANPFANKARTVDLEIGQPLNLREFNGPNVQVIVNGIEMSEIVVTLVHPRRMRIVEGRNVVSSNDFSAAPGQTSIRIKKENNSLVYQWGRTKVVYLDAMDTPPNHVRLGVISE